MPRDGARDHIVPLGSRTPGQGLSQTLVEEPLEPEHAMKVLLSTSGALSSVWCLDSNGYGGGSPR